MYSQEFLNKWYEEDIKLLIKILRVYYRANNSNKKSIRIYVLKLLTEINYIRKLQGKTELFISRVYLENSSVYFKDF